MCRVQQYLVKDNPGLHEVMLHSDAVGDVNEDGVAVSEVVGQTVALSTVIGARSITLEGMKSAIIHPHVRSSC